MEESAHHRKQTAQAEYLGDTMICQPLYACHRNCHQMGGRDTNLRCPWLHLALGQGVHLHASEDLHNASDPEISVFCFNEV